MSGSGPRPRGILMSNDVTQAPFGTVFGEHLPIARFDGDQWSAAEVVPLNSVQFGPQTHALHYASACFEGLKAHRQTDGSVALFRAEKNVARLRGSAERLVLPVPPTALCEELFSLAASRNADVTPPAPGSLYLRPTLIGTDPNIGAAGKPSKTAALYVIASPVGEYLPPHPLRILVETELPRTTPQFGVVKAGANYCMALGQLTRARQDWNADQILFAAGGLVEETGAANFILLDEGHLVTPAQTDAFLHGITKDSLLQLARARGWTVEERGITVEDLREWAARPTGEMALSGTAAILGGVGELIIDGEVVQVGTGETGPATKALRAELQSIQRGERTFEFR